jgi:hypothetical protein
MKTYTVELNEYEVKLLEFMSCIIHASIFTSKDFLTELFGDRKDLIPTENQIEELRFKLLKTDITLFNKE